MIKFYAGDPVIYVNGNRFELGIVERRHELPVKYYWNDREVHMFSYINKILRLYSKGIKRAVVCLYLDYNLENTECIPITEDLATFLLDNTDEFKAEQHYAYYIWYHTGDTVVYTDESNLHEISNLYAFTILRKQVDEDFETISTCREEASKIISRFCLEPSLNNKCINWLTKLLENKDVKPLQMNHEYLRCAIRLEVIDLLNEQNLKYTESDLTHILDNIFNGTSCNVLNMKVIKDAIKFYNEGDNLNDKTTNC